MERPWPVAGMGLAAALVLASDQFIHLPMRLVSTANPRADRPSCTKASFLPSPLTGLPIAIPIQIAVPLAQELLGLLPAEVLAVVAAGRQHCWFPLQEIGSRHWGWPSAPREQPLGDWLAVGLVQRADPRDGPGVPGSGDAPWCGPDPNPLEFRLPLDGEIREHGTGPDTSGKQRRHPAAPSRDSGSPSEHLRHGAAIAVLGLHPQAHFCTHRSQALQELPGPGAMGSLGYLRGVDAGQTDRQLLDPIPYPQGVAIPHQEHRGCAGGTCGENSNRRAKSRCQGLLLIEASLSPHQPMFWGWHSI